MTDSKLTRRALPPVIYGPLHRVEHIMGMPIGIEVHDPDLPTEVLEAAFAWFRWVDATFSTYRAESEISRLNRGGLTDFLGPG